MSAERRFRVQAVDWATAQSDLRTIRFEVFVKEQGVPESLEWDGIDPECLHVLAFDQAGMPIATGRLLPDGHIGRMAVMKDWRRRGVGGAVLAELLRLARGRGDKLVILHAQSYVKQFYERTGFRVTSA